jgi:uncharacterized DUF497 family protein
LAPAPALSAGKKPKTRIVSPIHQILLDDEWHSGDEDRELIIGQSVNGRLLIVSFTERNGMVRLISARETTNKERKDYEENAYYKR